MRSFGWPNIPPESIGSMISTGTPFTGTAALGTASTFVISRSCITTYRLQLRSCALQTFPAAAAVPTAKASRRVPVAASSLEVGTQMQTRAQPMDLTGFVSANAAEGSQQSLALLFSTIAVAVKQIAAKVSRAGLEGLYGVAEQQGGGSGDTQKKLDVIANEIMKSVLSSCPEVSVLASEEDDTAITVGAGEGQYVVVFDPLDGSRNIDAAIPTGTIFGVYRRPAGSDGLPAALQPGSQLLAAGYALYSSATMMVVSTGNGTHGFTLDPLTGEFMLTHHNIQIPKRGQIYSLNDARYHDWPKGLQQYIDTIRQGKGQNPKQYSARYICSLVGDFHRTLLYGGWCANPRCHLRLVYEANPLALLCEQAGGIATDGKVRILDIQPKQLHQRLPLFMGSPDDMRELMSYDDIQQLDGKKYEV